VEAFAAALNTVNVGKFVCAVFDRHDRARLYEAITRADRTLRQPCHRFLPRGTSFVDAYSRLVAMCSASVPSTTSAAPVSTTERYLLFNPMTKAKVTMEGETVLRALHDVIAAKGYEEHHVREVSQPSGHCRD
jgi:acyl-CoA dehydrogenase